MEYTVSPKFALSLAKLCVGYVSAGSIPVDPSNIRSDTASSLTFDDWEEAVSLPPIRLTRQASSATFSFAMEDRATRVTLEVVPGGELPTKEEHTVPGMEVSQFSKSGEASTIRPCEIKVPENITVSTRVLDPDGSIQIIYSLTTRTVFVSWPAPHARENCVAMFVLPEKTVALLSETDDSAALEGNV